MVTAKQAASTKTPSTGCSQALKMQKKIIFQKIQHTELLYKKNNTKSFTQMKYNLHWCTSFMQFSMEI